MRGKRRTQTASALRDRLEHGLERHVLRAGDRLPGTREIATEMTVDPRVVAAAYRQLAAEGLVEIRPRSGVYVAHNVARDGDLPPSSRLLAETLGIGIDNGFSIASFSEFIDDAARGGQIRAVVIAGTTDQAQGMCRELRADYGLDCSAILAESLDRRAPLPEAISRAAIVLTTDSYLEAVRALTARLEKPLVVVSMKPGVFGEAWKHLDRNDLVVIAADPRFLALVREFLKGFIGDRKVTLLLAGQDDLSGIARTTPTYVTEAARQMLGKTRVPGWVIVPPRMISPACSREILDVVVRLRMARRH